MTQSWKWHSTTLANFYLFGRSLDLFYIKEGGDYTECENQQAGIPGATSRGLLITANSMGLVPYLVYADPSP